MKLIVTIKSILVLITLGMSLSVSGNNTRNVVVTPVPDALQAVVLPVPRWQLIWSHRAVSSNTLPRMVIECLYGEMVLRHEYANMSTGMSNTSTFNVSGNIVTASADVDNNIHNNMDVHDNVIYQLMWGMNNTDVSVTTDNSEQLTFTLNNYRNMVLQLMDKCNV